MNKLIMLLPLIAMLIFTLIYMTFDSKTRLREWKKVLASIFIANTVVYLPTYLILL